MYSPPKPQPALTPSQPPSAPVLPLAVLFTHGLPTDPRVDWLGVPHHSFSHPLNQNTPLPLPALNEFLYVPYLLGLPCDSLCACLSQPHKIVNSRTMSCFLLTFAPSKVQEEKERSATLELM